MKKITSLFAAVAIATAAYVVSAQTWCMPGSYQEKTWNLESNHFEAVGDGSYTQTIPNLYGEFKIVKYEDTANWDTAWGTNDNQIENGVAYEATKGANNNIQLAGDNLHYINAKVTITPGEGDALTIKIEAERTETQVWCLPGSYQGWSLNANIFKSESDGSYTQTISDLYGDFKIVRVDDNSTEHRWDIQWGTNTTNDDTNLPINDGEEYAAVKIDGDGYGKEIKLAGDNLHYINAKVTITPGESNALTVKIDAERIEEEVWCMPGTYQGWSLEANRFEAVGDGSFTQTIPDLYGDFKIVRYVNTFPNWDIAWGTNGSNVENGVAYEAAMGVSDNARMTGDNLHYINAVVTITPGEGDALTILVQAERVVDGEETWHLVGEEPLKWNFENTPRFERGDGNVWTLAYIGTITSDFKVVKNRSWGNSYSTEGSIELDTEYTISEPKDPVGNMKPTEGSSWVNPKFKVVDNGDAGIVLSVSIQDPAGVEAVEAEAVKGEAVYFNLQGQRVTNPESGLYIRLQGGKATKVAL